MRSRELILMGITILLLLLLLKECSLNKNLAKLNVTPVYKELKGGVTKSGDSFKVIKSIELENSNLKYTIDSLKKELKLPAKTNVVHITSVTTKTDTVLVPVLKEIEVDGNTVFQLEHKDEWLQLSATFGNLPEFKVRAIDTLSFTSVRGRKETKVYVDNKSPYVSINQGYSYSIRNKKPWLTIGPHVGIDITGKPTLGVSVQYPLIRLDR
jgi:hypothetical protein